ncbi:MAG: DEAD/DEAH box helicase [Phycisphaerales bacterium]
MTASRPSSSRSSARSTASAKAAPSKAKPAAKAANRSATPKAKPATARKVAKPAAAKSARPKPAPKPKRPESKAPLKKKTAASKPSRPSSRPEKPVAIATDQRETELTEPMPALVSFDEPREPRVAPFTPARPELRPPSPRPVPSPSAAPPPRDLHRPQPPAQQAPPRRDDRPSSPPPHRPPHEDRRPAPKPWHDQRDNRNARDNGRREQNQPPQSSQPRPAPPVQAPSPAPAPHAAPSAPTQPPAPPAAPAMSTAEAARKHQEEIFDKQTKFADLGLSEPVMRGITEAGFVYPTAIQARLIPLILSGRDMLGQAKTGTGKTASFGLPLLTKIEKGRPFQALVLVPTRELAIQVATDLRELGRFTGLNILPVYGGQNISTQAQLLAKGPEIVVATPGRVMDMVQRNYMNYRGIRVVVLDEVDRMLDIGFRDDIRRILGSCPKDRQTIFVSATISPDIESLARSFANNAEKIIASAGSLTVAMVAQRHLSVQPWDKKQLLLHLLTHEEPALTVVFCRTKRTVDNLTEYLTRKGVDCHAIHGDMYQNKRNQVMEKLRSGKLEVLIASDVASRGLDVEGITHVINYDLPEDPDVYVHRIGRTARAGRDGVAWSLVTPEQGELLTQIELFINAEIPKLDYPDFKPGPIPPDVLARQQQQAQRVESARQFNRFSSNLPPVAPAATTAPARPASGGQPAQATPVAPAVPDPNRFPGGIVPTQAPLKRMFGKVKTARSMKQAAQQQPVVLPPAQPSAQPSA